MDRLTSSTNNGYEQLESIRHISPVNTGTTGSILAEQNCGDEHHALAKEEEKRRIKLVMLMQQLDFLFYALVVSCYMIDGKNLIFILRTVSEVQFSQPKQIQPDRPLRFFTLASFAICVCGLLGHLSLLSSSNHNPSGILVDFIGQSTWKHQAIAVIFLIGLDISSCFVQLLLVLISFTQSHSISISWTTSVGSSPRSFMIGIDQNDVEEGGNQSSPISESGGGLSSKSIPIEEPMMNESSELLRRRSHQSRSTSTAESFLFDLTISEVISCLFSTNSPTNLSDSTTTHIATPTSTPSPSRTFESVFVAPVIPESTRPVTEDHTDLPSSLENHHLSPSTGESLASTNLPSRSEPASIV